MLVASIKIWMENIEQTRNREEEEEEDIQLAISQWVWEEISLI